MTGASSYHSAGYTGSGVKVAVIDLGFAGLSSAISDGELSDTAVMVDCTGSNCVPTDFSSETGLHGTACAEIVYDMAPEAELYLIKIVDTLDLKDAKDYSIDNGIKIINASLGICNTNFYSGGCYYSNPVCTANDAYSNGILWVNAMGNYAEGHYEATFTDSDDDGWHNVSGNFETIIIEAIAGDIIQLYLTWNAWPTTDQDYDLCLLDSSLNLVASSVTRQTGTQPPIEEISYSVPATGTYQMAIYEHSATSDHQLEVFSAYHDTDPAVASSSIISPADATGVMAVGAIDHENWTTGPQESFSCQGPTNDGRTKPEISGPDGVSSYTYGDSFLGTSAASPHVTGAAALILSKNPTYSVSELWNALTSSTVDMGSSGQDNIYGYGRLNLPPVPPTVNTGSATSVTSSSATLNGTVNPNGASTTYYFEYGTSYGSTTTETDAGSGTEEVSVSADLTGLSEGTTYHFRLVATNSAGTDYGDNATFTTTTTPPTVSSTTPANNATDVGVNTTITAIFSEEMDASTITTDTFTVSGSGNIAGTVTYSDATATFTPTATLDYNKTYTATITTGAKDLAGNALEADYTWSFTTESETPTDGEPPSDGGGGGGCFISVM